MLQRGLFGFLGEGQKTILVMQVALALTQMKENLVDWFLKIQMSTLYIISHPYGKEFLAEIC